MQIESIQANITHRQEEKMDIGSWLTEVACTTRTPNNPYAQSIQKSLAAERTARKASQANPASSSPSVFDTPATTVTFSGKAERYSYAQRALSALSPEVVAEAQRRLDNGVETAYLPMTKENKALYDEITQELGTCDFSTAEGRSRAATLGNMRHGLERSGWKEPMTKAQAEFEHQVGSAKLALNTLNGVHDAYYEAWEKAVLSANPNNMNDAMKRLENEWAASRPVPARYAEKGLTMPRTPYYQLMDMAKAGGISDEEFGTAARNYAKTMSDPDLYYALEEFISTRYTGKSA